MSIEKKLYLAARYQSDSRFHPLTCEKHTGTRMIPFANEKGKIRWRCPIDTCGWMQGWDPLESLGYYDYYDDADDPLTSISQALNTAPASGDVNSGASSSMDNSSIGRFLTRIRELGQVTRWNNRFRFTIENVAEHTTQVALLILVMGAIEQRFYGRTVNLEKALSGALLHDLDEVMTGDVLAPTKHNNPKLRMLLRETELGAIDLMLSDLPDEVGEIVGPLWKNAKDESYEGLMVDGADKFSALLYAVHEIKLGNFAFVATARRLLSAIVAIPVVSLHWLVSNGLVDYIHHDLDHLPEVLQRLVVEIKERFPAVRD